MSTMPDHLRPITVEIPVNWTAGQALAVWEILDELRKKIWARYSCQLQDLLAEEQRCADVDEVTRLLGISTSERLIDQRDRNDHPVVRSRRPSWRPDLRAQRIAEGGAQRPRRLRARRHPHRRDGRRRERPDRWRPPRADQDAPFSRVSAPPLTAVHRRCDRGRSC
jgi:hypothetical protein